MSDYFKIICELCSPLCNEPPQLDALLYNEIIFKHGLCKQGEKLGRSAPISKFKTVRIPLKSINFMGVPVYYSSNPIYKCIHEFREDFCYHFEPELSFLLCDNEKKSISCVSGVYKDRRLPLRLKLVDTIVWFCNGTMESVLELLHNINSIGSLRKQGFGVVHKWKAEKVDYDYSIYADNNGEKILMKNIPEKMVDKKATGYTIAYGACSPPYWHPGRFMNIGKPC